MPKTYCSQCHEKACGIVKKAPVAIGNKNLINFHHDRLLKTCTHSVENPNNKTKKGYLR